MFEGDCLGFDVVKLVKTGGERCNSCQGQRGC